MGKLFDTVQRLVADEKYVIGQHASERLEERRIMEWQAVANVADGELLRERPRSRPNPVVEIRETLPDGTEFKGPAELRNILLGRSDQFATAVTEKLLTYAMGRGAEYFDGPAIRKIKRGAAPDYRWSSLIMEIVKSEPFQMRSRQP